MGLLKFLSATNKPRYTTTYFLREDEICVVFTFIVLILIEQILESLLSEPLDLLFPDLNNDTLTPVGTVPSTLRQTEALHTVIIFFSTQIDLTQQQIFGKFKKS